MSRSCKDGDCKRAGTAEAGFGDAVAEGLARIAARVALIRSRNFPLGRPPLGEEDSILGVLDWGSGVRCCSVKLAGGGGGGADSPRPPGYTEGTDGSGLEFGKDGLARLVGR